MALPRRAYVTGLLHPAVPGLQAGGRWSLRGLSGSGFVVYLRTMAVFLVVWHLGAVWIGRPVLLPTPLQAAQAFVQLARDGDLTGNALTSLRRLGISFCLAGLVGIPLGLAMGLSRLVGVLLDPVVELLRPISGIAWIPLGLFLVGVGDELPILIMFYGAVFPFILNSMAGVRGVDARLVQAAQTLGVGRWTVFRHVVLPAALPGILVGARLAAGNAWMAMVAAELIGAPSGLGFAVEWYRELLMTPKVLAFIFLIGFLGYLVDRVLRACQRRLTPWAQTVGGGA